MSFFSFIYSTLHLSLSLSVCLADTACSPFSFPHVFTLLSLCLHSSHCFFSHHFVCMSTSLSSKHPPPVDVWSVGCIVAEMIRGSVLFPGTDRILPHQRFITVSSLFLCVKASNTILRVSPLSLCYSLSTFPHPTHMCPLSLLCCTYTL